MQGIGFAAAAFALLAGCAAARSEPCFDLAKGEPHALDGVIERRLFAGSMADVMSGRTSEAGFLLKLDAPICLVGDDFADPKAPFREAEVRATGAAGASLRRSAGKRVHVTLSHPYAAMTVHDHRPLVATVESLSLAPPPR